MIIVNWVFCIGGDVGGREGLDRDHMCLQFGGCFVKRLTSVFWSLNQFPWLVLVNSSYLCLHISLSVSSSHTHAIILCCVVSVRYNYECNRESEIVMTSDFPYAMMLVPRVWVGQRDWVIRASLGSNTMSSVWQNSALSHWLVTVVLQ